MDAGWSLVIAASAEVSVRAPNPRSSLDQNRTGQIFIQITAGPYRAVADSTSGMLQFVSSPFSLPDVLLPGYKA